MRIGTACFERSAPLRLLLVVLLVSPLILACGCSVFGTDWINTDRQKTEAPELRPCQKELDDKQRDILNAFKEGQPTEDVLRVLQSADPSCNNLEALYLYALRLGRHDLDFLVPMAYALYRGSIFSFRDEFATWKRDVYEKDMVERLLYGVWRQERLYRQQGIPFVEYSAGVRKVTDFFAWFVANVLPDARKLADAGVDLTELEVPELRLLTHSSPTFMTYFGRYAEHEILGNMRNFDFMRARFMELLMTDKDQCEAVSSLGMSGLRILELEPHFILQATADASQAGAGSLTSAYAFIRSPKDGEMIDRLLVVVPADRNDTYREWSRGNSYLLKPVRTPEGFSPVLEAQFRERETREEDPVRKVFRLLGKINEEPKPLYARIRFVEPEVYRMVSYVETPFLRDLFEACGALPESMMRIPGAKPP